MFRHILFPSDLSPRSTAAFAPMLALARRLEAKVTLIHVTDMGSIAEAHLHDPTFTATATEIRLMLEEKAQIKLAELKKQLDEARLLSEIVIVEGHPGEQIVKAATERQCDVIVMASRGLGPVNAVLLGSKSTWVLHHSPVPVLVLPPSVQDWPLAV